MPTIARRRTAALRERIAALEAQLYAAEAELQDARVDPVTGLPTRAHWTRLAETSWTSAAAVVLVDLDGFKNINDTHGHAAGDLLLARTAHRLAASLPGGSIAGRLGGDEFAAVTTRPLTGRDLDRVIEEVTAPLRVPGGPVLRVGLSVGVATPDPLTDPALTSALNAADLAMYDAKRAGGGWRTYRPDQHGTPAITTRPLHRTRHRDAA